MIQRPEEKPGTAVVLKGSKGVGKDTVGDYVGGLFPRHHTKIAHAEHLVGRFNSHHEKTLLLHVEEGFWAGNPSAEGMLKHIITSPQVQIERKGIDAFQVPSVLRVFVSSNEDWVVPASFDERRFFVLNIAGKKREPAYFEALHREMNTGGRAALLHHLQHVDLSDFDVRNLRTALADVIAREKAYNVPALCERLGLATGNEAEAMASKFRYASARLAGSSGERLVAIARLLLDDEPDFALAELLAKVTEAGTPVVSELTRRRLTAGFDSEILCTEYDEIEFLETIWPLSSMPGDRSNAGFDEIGFRSLKDDIFQHMRRNDDWSNRELLGRG